MPIADDLQRVDSLLGDFSLASLSGGAADAEDPEAMAEREAWLASCRDQAQRRAVVVSGIPPRLIGRGLETYEATTPGQVRALTVARTYASWAAPAASVVLIGTPGTGKTHLSCAMATEAARAGAQGVQYTTLARMISAVRIGLEWGSGTSYDAALAPYVEPDVLIIDEIGMSAGNEMDKRIIFEVINARYNRQRGCILAANASNEQVEALLGERVIDRLREDGCTVVPMRWASWRARGR